MYKKGFYITENKGNNTFSFEKRKNKKLYVPSLIKANLVDIKLQDDIDKIAFEDYSFDDKLQSCFGLKNFYKLKWKNKYIFLFDNHNHAFYFWYLAKYNKIIGNNNTLYHIDEHSDMRKPKKFLDKSENIGLQKVFEYTNFELNVGNYISPAVKDGLVKEVIQIRSEFEIIDSIKNINNNKNNSIILNLDLDFFNEELDYIDYSLKKKITLDIAKKAEVITVATSPFFINQKLAIKVFKDLFGN